MQWLAVQTVIDQLQVMGKDEKENHGQSLRAQNKQK